jgi:predicted secreted protein
MKVMNKILPVIIIIIVLASSVLVHQYTDQLLKKDEVKDLEPILMSDMLYIRVETDKDVYQIGENITASFWVVNEADKDWNATFYTMGIWDWAIMDSDEKNITPLTNAGIFEALQDITVLRNSTKFLKNVTLSRYDFNYFNIVQGKFYIYAHFHFNWGAPGWEYFHIFGGKLIEIKAANSTFTEGDNGLSIHIEKNEEFNVTLISSPSTGYEWYITNCDYSVLELTNESFEYYPKPPGWTGTPGWNNFTFKGLADGKFKLKFVRGYGSIGEFTLNVTVGSGSSDGLLTFEQFIIMTIIVIVGIAGTIFFIRKRHNRPNEIEPPQNP